MKDMLDTMYAAPGIGLAAVQIGVPTKTLVSNSYAQARMSDYKEGVAGSHRLQANRLISAYAEITHHDADGSAAERMRTGCAVGHN